MDLTSIRSDIESIGSDALVQVAASLALVAAVWLIARGTHVTLGADPFVAAARALVQVVLVGFLLAAVLSLHVGWAGLILLVMCAIGAGISAKRAGKTPGVYAAALVGIVAGTTVAVVAMVAMGALAPSIRELVPVGSIFIATCMRTASVAFERQAREGGGADARHAAIHASLIPAVDGMKSLGFVWIPGVMTGLILAGASPVRAAFLQFVVVAIAFVAAAITSIVSTWRLPAEASPGAAHDNP